MPRRRGRWKGAVGISPNWFVVGVLLLLISEKPSHGYEIISRMSEFGFNIDGIGKMGNLYRLFSELEMNGLIVSSWDTTSPGPAKKIYHITPQGLFFLKNIQNSAFELEKNLEKFLKRCKKINQEGI